ncbi:MAG: 4-(cytidine 5'-diphospho)-2-C-methyl-D-erythritol kinase [Ignavibacteria bacterium]
MDYLLINAPAKINFGLYVVSKRTDGFHDIETIFYPLYDFADELTFSRSDRFEFLCNDKSLEGNDNLIVKAKNLLEEYSGRQINVKIELTKIIPVGAGMGGGSSDAATTLISLNEMFALKTDDQNLRRLALELGSDVPFFIKPKPSFAESRGEALTLLNFDVNLPMLIVNPGIHISTKEAYQNIKAKKASFDLKKLTGYDFNSPVDIIKHVTNDFEEYVFNAYPEIEKIKEKLYRHGAKFSLMTGSGSTVFGIFNTIEKAEKVRHLFPDHYFTFISQY